jgi:hypothetical protein
MNEKKRVFESVTMALPPLQMVLGEIPSPDPERRGKGNTSPLKPEKDLVIPVKRLIAHLMNQK